MGRVAMKGWAVGCNERQMGGEKQKYDTYINSSSGTENAKKMQLPTCDVAFSPLHFFATLINFCIFFTKKNVKNANKNATAPKQMQRRMRKKCNFQSCIFWVAFFLQLATSHFLSWFFFLFETCDIAFSNLLVFGKLLQQATHLGLANWENLTPTLSLQN